MNNNYSVQITIDEFFQKFYIELFELISKTTYILVNDNNIIGLSIEDLSQKYDFLINKDFNTVTKEIEKLISKKDFNCQLMNKEVMLLTIKLSVSLLDSNDGCTKHFFRNPKNIVLKLIDRQLLEKYKNEGTANINALEKRIIQNNNAIKNYITNDFKNFIDNDIKKYIDNQLIQIKAYYEQEIKLLKSQIILNKTKNNINNIYNNSQNFCNFNSTKHIVKNNDRKKNENLELKVKELFKKMNKFERKLHEGQNHLNKKRKFNSNIKYESNISNIEQIDKSINTDKSFITINNNNIEINKSALNLNEIDFLENNSNQIPNTDKSSENSNDQINIEDFIDMEKLEKANRESNNNKEYNNKENNNNDNKENNNSNIDGIMKKVEEHDKSIEILKAQNYHFFRSLICYGLTTEVISSELDIKNIKEFVYPSYPHKRIYYSLIYSTLFHEKNASLFHLHCNNINNTLTLIKTADGLKIGGFCHEKWTSEFTIDPEDNNIYDNKCFIFSLTENKYSPCDGKYIYSDRNCGPSFGYKAKSFYIGNDFIHQDCVIQNENTRNLINNGNKFFTINVLEVYHVIFQDEREGYEEDDD